MWSPAWDWDEKTSQKQKQNEKNRRKKREKKKFFQNWDSNSWSRGVWGTCAPNWALCLSLSHSMSLSLSHGALHKKYGTCVSGKRDYDIGALQIARNSFLIVNNLSIGQNAGFRTCLKFMNFQPFLTQKSPKFGLIYLKMQKSLFCAHSMFYTLLTSTSLLKRSIKATLFKTFWQIEFLSNFRGLSMGPCHQNVFFHLKSPKFDLIWLKIEKDTFLRPLHALWPLNLY